jgi:3'-phosphoadenosine 5'-phosphosulfate sulfotransferase (PAPS reductase)/FAD synthetase
MYTVREHPHPKYFISWGKGLQSTALCVLSALGEIRKVDAIVTAETGWEHPHTYEMEKFYTKWLEDAGIPVYKVQAGNVQEDIYEDHSALPLWTSETGAPLRRQCTAFYKIHPIRKKIRELCGLRADNKGRTLKNTAIIYLGISVDEAERMRTSDRAWIKNDYPLIDLRWSREDCKLFLEREGLPIPLKSSCVICPYKGADFWLRTLKIYPEEFQKAVKFDKAIRTPPKRMIERGYDFQCYIWKGRKPLDEEDFQSIVDKKDESDICDSGYCFL